jgi:hypothetical protein
MFSGKSPSFVVLSSLGLLIYSSWQMVNNILPNLQIFNIVYDTLVKTFNAFKFQSKVSMTNIQFLIYVVLLVAFIILIFILVQLATAKARVLDLEYTLWISFFLQSLRRFPKGSNHSFLFNW